MLYLLIAAFFWGTSFIAAKITYLMADPTLIVLFRMIIAGTVMLPVSVRYFYRGHAQSKKFWAKLILIGVLTYPVSLLGLNLTSGSSAATVIGIEPLMVAIVGVVIFKEKASPLIILLGIMAFAGVALVVGSDSGEISLLGCFLVLLSTVAVAFWLRLPQQMLSEIDTKPFTALSIQLGTLAGLPLMLALVKNW